VNPTPQFGEAYYMRPDFTQVVISYVIPGKQSKKKEQFSAVTREQEKPRLVISGLLDAQITERIPQRASLGLYRSNRLTKQRSSLFQVCVEAWLALQAGGAELVACGLEFPERLQPPESWGFRLVEIHRNSQRFQRPQKFPMDGDSVARKTAFKMLHCAPKVLTCTT
jgi:hypothetical protein